MKISKYMTTKLMTVESDLSVKDAFLIMKEHEIRHLPVVDGGALIGIISDRDLRRPKWADATEDWTSYYHLDDETSVADVMTKNPEVVRTSDSVQRAVRILREKRYGALPVVDKSGHLAGILSAYDLLRALEDVLAQE